MTQIFAIALATGLTLLAACGATRSQPGAAAAKTDADKPVVSPHSEVDFLSAERFADVPDRARAEDKLVFVDFYTSWCLPCKLMDEDVFSDARFGDFMNERFVSVKIDAEAGNGPKLAALYGVRAYPTLLWVDADGRVRARREGAAYQTELRRLSREALGSVN